MAVINLTDAMESIKRTRRVSVGSSGLKRGQLHMLSTVGLNAMPMPGSCHPLRTMMMSKHLLAKPHNVLMISLESDQ